MERTQRTQAAIKLAGARRLASLLGMRERRARRPYVPTYEEEEVRARIYGWRSGTVEPPEPTDSTPPLGPLR